MRTGFTSTHRLVGALSVFVICSLLGYTYYIYQRTYQTTLAQIDNTLLNAAVSADHILGPDYHTDLGIDSPGDRLIYQQKSQALSELAQHLGLEYVYAMVLNDNKVYFTSSSYTKADQENGKLTRFYDFYPEATAENIRAFFSTEPVYEVSEDHWGHFRSVFVPHISRDGRTYLTGADISMTRLNAILNANLLSALTASGFLLLLALLCGAFGYMMLKRQRQLDSTSGTANYRALETYLKEHNQLHFELALIQVMEFENISGLYGPNLADQLVRKLIEKVRSDLAQQVLVFRVASDKLVILSQGSQLSERKKQRLETLLNEPYWVVAPLLRLRLCAGVASGHKSMLLGNAHQALAQARQDGKTLLTFSDCEQELKQHYRHDAALAEMCEEALEQKRIAPYFSPITCQQSGQVWQYQCEARLITDKGQVLRHDQFAPLLNRCRHGGEATRTLFLQNAARFRDTDIKWSLPLFADDMHDFSLLSFLEQQLLRYPTPGNITLDLYEAETLDNFTQTRLFVSRLKSKGVKLMLADFAAGASHVENARKLDFNGIKLAPILTASLNADERLGIELERLANYCREKNLLLVASGVNNELSYNKLLELGINLMQGEYIGAAEPHILDMSEQPRLRAEA